MTIKVIKKSGEKELFQREKIENALNSALKSANLEEEKRKKIVEDVLRAVLEYLKKKKQVYSAEIEAKILIELEKVAPEIISIWREHRRKKIK